MRGNTEAILLGIYMYEVLEKTITLKLATVSIKIGNHGHPKYCNLNVALMQYLFLYVQFIYDFLQMYVSGSSWL